MNLACNIDSGLTFFFPSARLTLLTRMFRTPDGEMFVVKDPDTFASDVIPQVR